RSSKVNSTAYCDKHSSTPTASAAGAFRVHTRLLGSAALRHSRGYLNLHQRVLRESRHLYGRPSRRDRAVRGHTARIHLVHCGKIAHVLKEDRGLYHVGQPAACRGEHRCNVLEHSLCLLANSTFYQDSCSRIQRNLP